MKELYCPVCRSKLQNQYHCNFCGVKLDMKIIPTDYMIKEYKEKLKGIG